MTRVTLLALSLIFFSPTLWAYPAQILIIRHGEKIDDFNPHLSDKGKRRAQALIKVFLNDPRFNSYGPPVAIFAAKPKYSDSSVRPEETVQPLADKLHLEVNLEFNKKEGADLIDEVFSTPAFNDKTVIVCWSHQLIVDLAHVFGAQNVPEKWPHNRFDRVWRIKYDEKGKAGKLEDLPERALPSDSQK